LVEDLAEAGAALVFTVFFGTGLLAIQATPKLNRDDHQISKITDSKM
jgi:hypothetical protein